MSVIFIDVREPDEYESGHVKGALNIPVGQISPGSAAVEGLPKDSQIVTYCRSGGRAGRAKTLLQNMGFQDIVNGINQQHIEAEYNSLWT